MVDYTALSDGDFDSASNFGFMHGRTNASDYVEFGMDITFDPQVPEFSITGGKAFVLIPEEEDSQQPGTYRRRVGKGFDIDHDDSFQIPQNDVTYVWAVTQISTENSGGENDQPYFEVNQSQGNHVPSPPVSAPISESCLLVGIIDTVNDVAVEANRAPDMTAETLRVLDDMHLEGDLYIDKEEALISLGKGKGPHSIDFGAGVDEAGDIRANDGFSITSDTQDRVLRTTHGGLTQDISNVTEEGNVGILSGSLGVGEVPTSPRYGNGREITVVESGDENVASVEARGSGQGSGSVYVGQSSTFGGGMAYDGDNVPAMPFTEDALSLYRRHDGEDVEVAHWDNHSNKAHFHGEVSLVDNPLSHVDSVRYEPESNQAVYYTGAEGDYSIRDRSNDDEKVLTVGQGRLTVNRSLRAAGGLQLTEALQMNGFPIGGVGGDIRFSSSGGAGLDFTRNSDGSHYIWKHTDGDGNMSGAHSQPDNYHLSLEYNGHDRHKFNVDGSYKSVSGGGDGFKIGSGGDRPYLAPIVDNDRKWGSELTYENGEWVSEAPFAVKDGIDLRDTKIDEVEGISYSSGRADNYYSGSWHLRDKDAGGSSVFRIGNNGHITTDRQVDVDSSMFVNNRGYGNTTHDRVDIAIGDNDTGLGWIKDGIFGMFSNGQEILHVAPYPQAFIVSTKTHHENDVRLDQNDLTDVNDIYFWDKATDEHDPRIFVRNGNLMYQSPNGQPEVVKYGR